MHKFFADWYRLAKLQTTSEELGNRWQGIESLVKGANYRTGLELVRIFYGRPLKQNTSLDNVHNAFKEADQTFPLRDNELELRVLAGAAIVYLLEQEPNKKTDAVALATLCAYCQKLRSEVLLPDVVDYAKDYVINEAVRVRTLGTPRMAKVIGDEIQPSLDALKAACTGTNLANIAEPITPPFEAITKVLNHLTEVANEGMETLADNLKVQQEETNMLRWVFGEHSSDLNKRMSDVPFSGACLVAGKELADLTVLKPGPRTAVAILDKMLHTSFPRMKKATTISEAVNALPQKWVELFVSEGAYPEVDDLCPVRTGVNKFVEVGDGWTSAFERVTGLRVDQQLSPLELALEMYQEQILCHVVGQ